VLGRPEAFSEYFVEQHVVLARLWRDTTVSFDIAGERILPFGVSDLYGLYLTINMHAFGPNNLRWDESLGIGY
jgi:hypothetical protein